MTLFSLFAALLLAALSAFGSSYLSSAWKRRTARSEGAAAVEALLPGYDCSLCGQKDCRSYAAAVDGANADPALCSPGGAELEEAIRALLGHRRGDQRGKAMCAVVRCGGGGAARKEYVYSGHQSCLSASLLYGGPNTCKEGCIGYGTCAEVCPVGAIVVEDALARIVPSLCTGCGLCAASCPTGVISLVPRESEWYVACYSHQKAEKKKDACAAACTACGECSRLSSRFEFSVLGELARENPSVENGNWEEIAAACPSSAIVRAGSQKKSYPPFQKPGR
jgi:Na+-translocating ferredoxin:NAD+ oxidoreductase RNF subunit RnfB